MGQFLGFESYDLKRMCDICGEIGLEADMIDHENYCQGTSDEEEFVTQSEQTLKEMEN